MAIETSLRQEIVSAEKSRADFQKWKVVLVASLGTVALGLGRSGENNSKSYTLLLCGIPLVCGYVDLLCAHLTLRILVIAAFLRNSKDCYEVFVQDLRKRANPFVLEDWVMYGSTVILSLAVGIYGPAAQLQPTWPYPFSGLLGLVIAVVTYSVGESKQRELKS